MSMGKMERTYLKAEREKRELGMKEVAEHLGISRTYYGQIENGRRRPGGKLALKISDFFGVDIRKILKG
jgi:putative transcriptional regulator